jgi:hypothetical protein
MSRTKTSGAGSTEPLPLSEAGLRHSLPIEVRHWWNSWRRREVPKIPERPVMTTGDLVQLLRETS